MKVFLIRRIFLIIFIIPIISSGFFVGENNATAGYVDHVVISEIYATGTNDWIELYNPTNKDINLEEEKYRIERATKSGGDPKFYISIGNTKHGSYGSTKILSERFYLIVDEDASESLREKADAIIKKKRKFSLTDSNVVYLATGSVGKPEDEHNNDKDMIDYVGYDEAKQYEGNGQAPAIPDNKSIQRIFSEDGKVQDINDNSVDFLVSEKPNPQNSSGREDNDEDDKDDKDDKDDEDDEDDKDDIIIPIVYSSKIRINELLPDPKEKPEKDYEYIELYNYGDEEIDLENWEIKDANILKKENGKGKKLSGIIESKKYLVFYKTVSLNNSGDEIRLFDPDGGEVDSVAYGKAEENYAYGFNSEAWEWTPFLTLGKVNQFKVKKNYASSIRINEILPNPSGDEKLNEYIELYNSENIDIDLAGWILKDSSKSGKFIFSENSPVKAKGFKIIYRADFKFAMNNSGSETIYFLDPNENIVSSISYSKAREDVSYNFNELGWRWSKFLTPGAENKFNNLPKIEIKIDKKIYKKIYADFKVKINDPDKDKIKVTWDFGDGRKSYKKKTRHKYKETGKYSVSLKVFDGSEEIIKKFKIKVKKVSHPKVRITRFMPNPKGKDSELEWIEIKNKSNKKINLKNWSIATGSSSKKITNHPIYEDFFIKPGKANKIMRNLSKFSLNNKKGRVELRYPDGKVAYKIKYKKEDGVKDDEIYGKEKGEKWKWTKDVLNVQTVEVVENIEDTEGKEGVEIILGDEDVKNVPDIEIVQVIEDERYVGGQSTRLSDDKKVAWLIGELGAEALENLIINLNNSDIEEINNIYIFNSLTSSDKHYALKFLEKLLREINQALNNRLNLLN